MITQGINPKKMKAVIFDWGGVCCSEGEPFASKALQQAIGMGPDDICKTVMSVYLDFYRGRYPAETFWQLVLAHFGLQEQGELRPTKLTQAYLDSYTIWQDVLDVAKRLQSSYTVGLLSDLTKEMRDHIQAAHNTSDYFHVQMFSCDDDAGFLKNEGPEIFLRMLAKMNVASEEVLFIDNSKSKIAVAQEAGLQTMLFVDKEQFFNDIKLFV